MDPQRPVTDADREAAVAALRRHAGEGAIDLDQFGDRTTAVLAATTVADLQAVFADLPGGVPVLPTAVPAPAHPRVAPVGMHPFRPSPWAMAHLRRVAPLALLFVAIWAITGFGYFWPAWPILGITIAAVKRGRCAGRPHWA